MNIYIKYSLLSLLLFFAGIVFFAYQESWIILNIPQANIWNNLKKPEAVNIEAPLFAFKNNQWIKETKQIIKTNNTAQNVQNLINNWFLLAQEEAIVTKNIIAESVVLSPTKKTAFVSLNHNPFSSQASTYSCLMLLEGIFKTIRENNIQLQTMQFLIQHKPWIDHRLNMEIAWPVTGYITQ